MLPFTMSVPFLTVVFAGVGVDVGEGERAAASLEQGKGAGPAVPKDAGEGVVRAVVNGDTASRGGMAIFNDGVRVGRNQTQDRSMPTVELEGRSGAGTECQRSRCEVIAVRALENAVRALAALSLTVPSSIRRPPHTKLSLESVSVPAPLLVIWPSAVI
jgi:hypothetical protein